MECYSDQPIEVKDLSEPVLSLVIPTYEESQNLPELFARIEKMLKHVDFEIIIVDDNSRDGTAALAEELNNRYRNIKVYRRSGKLGLSSAVISGFESSEGNIVAVIDADMQHPPEILLEMYDEVCRGSDLVIASRYESGGGIENWKLSRKLYSKGATTLAHILLPKSRKVKDVMSGCFMLKKDALKKANLNPVGFKILLEIVSKCEFNQIKEVPYLFRNRINGRSNLTKKEAWNYLVHLYRLFYYRISTGGNVII